MAEPNTITVGLRSDGQISIMSSPNTPGPVAAQNFIMSREVATWLAREILRLSNAPVPSAAQAGGSSDE